MLLRIATWGLILLATSIVSAQDTSKTSNPPVPHPTNACPAQNGPHVTDDTTRAKQQRLLQQKCAEMDRLQREITRLRASTGTVQQIVVKVQILEVSLSKIRDAGMDTVWFANGCASRAEIRKLLDSIAARKDVHLIAPVAQAESNASVRFVDWLGRNSMAKVLSEQTLVTVSGRPVSVHAGGEFPVPANGDSKTAVDFMTFGTEMKLLASALGDNQVRLEVNARVSTLDYQRAIDMSGARIPGLRVRQFNTGLELSFGETAVLTGLVEQRTEARQNESPQIEDAVVDVGLMVVVTPERVSLIETPAVNANRDTNRSIKK